VTIGTLVLGVENVQLLTLAQNPVRTGLNAAPIWTILFLVMAITGIVVQIQVNRAIQIESYNRLASQ
jgi:hypothetical protein